MFGGIWELKKTLLQTISCEETQGRFGNEPVTLTAPRPGKQWSTFCSKTNTELTLNWVGNHPIPRARPLAAVTAYKQPGTVKWPPALGKVACGLTFFRQGASA